MSRYFFHTQDGQVLRDHVGVDLPDQAAAQVEALRVMGQMLARDAEQFWKDGGWTLAVSDASGLELFRIDVVTTFSAVARQPT